MKNIAGLMEQLSSRDNAEAYSAFQQLKAESRETNCVYPYLADFLRMLSGESSYQRTRGLLLICANARWDAEGRIDQSIGAILEHIRDVKPSVSRQLIQSLPDMARWKPRLVPRIQEALRNADLSGYRDSIRPLVEKDIQAALAAIGRQSE